MKTNQVMIRPMGEFKVIQRTKDAFFNATDLLKQWNQLKGMKKEVSDYFDLSSTKEFIYTIMERENYDTGNYPYHKSRANKGDNAGTWMHPLLFIDFAMWINLGLVTNYGQLKNALQRLYYQKHPVMLPL